MLRTADLINDRYRLEAHVASGGMGEVWRATDTVLGRTVAIKVMLPALLADPDFGARFRAEARMMATLRHPSIVNVYDFGESGGTVFLVMGFVDGEPLSERIASIGRLSVAETLAVVSQTASALQAAHDGGIVHRDVKPSNLLVQPDGAVMLVDFGVARSSAITAITSTHAVPGTALYMAPEQASGAIVTGATDVYALGAVAYHCLSGTPPFTGDSPLSVAVKHMHDEVPPLPGDIPAPVRALVMRALRKDPSERYPSATALAQAARALTGPRTGAAAALPAPRPGGRTRLFEPATLDETEPVDFAPRAVAPVGGGSPGDASPDTAPAPATAPADRNRRRLLLAGGLGVVLVGLVTVVLLASHGGGAPVQGPLPSRSPVVVTSHLATHPADTATRTRGATPTEHRTRTAGPTLSPSAPTDTGAPTGVPTEAPTSTAGDGAGDGASGSPAPAAAN